MAATQIRVGVLGAGQLSLMLCEAAKRLQLKPVVFASSQDEPAIVAGFEAVVGSLENETALKDFFSRVDVVTYENDFLPYPLLDKFQKTGTKFSPELSILKDVRDKIRQKELFKSLKISSPDFRAYLEKEKLEDWVKAQFEYFKNEVVFKWARGGYDGKGVHLARDVDHAVAFCEEALKKKFGIFAERKVSFKRELALVSVFNGKDFNSYPLVVSEQQNGICKRVTGPAVSLGVSESLEKQARLHSENLARGLNLTGAFAIEFFEDTDGTLWANELAPRVHNSGHFSMDASETSQFENHWHGVLGKALGSTKSDAVFCMVNLLGCKEPALGAISKSKPTLPAHIHLHWYGKKDLRPGRKLGHLNGLSRVAADMPQLINLLSKYESECLSYFYSKQNIK